MVDYLCAETPGSVKWHEQLATARPGGWRKAAYLDQ